MLGRYPALEPVVKLSQKLFWSLLLTALGAVGLLLLVLRWGLADSFAAYIRAGDEARLNALVPVFEQLYDDQTGWSGIRPPEGAAPPPLQSSVVGFRQGLQTVALDMTQERPFDEQRLRPPPPDQRGDGGPPGWGPPPLRDGLPPPRQLQQTQRSQQQPVQQTPGVQETPGAASGTVAEEPHASTSTSITANEPAGDAGPPAREQLPRLAPDLPSLGERFSVYDSDGRLVLGHHVFASNVITRELHRQGQRIGYLGLASLPPSMPGSEQAFMDQEYRRLLLALTLVLALSGMVALWLSRSLLGGVSSLLHGNAELRRGNFSVRLPVQSQDELGKLAEDFNNLAQSLERTEKARQQWAADIAHELRTPLTVMRAELESIQDGVYPMDGRRVDLLHQDVLQLTRLVEDLNVLAMADMGALHYHLTSVQPDSLVGRIADSMRARCAEKGIELHLRLNAPTLHIKADVQKITQLLNNVLENACRYTDAPGQIQITSRSGARVYELIIEDSPPGVPDWALPRLFDRLFRLDKSRSRAHGGSGLGLAICQTIVAAHGGRMLAQHSGLGGLLVRIELPFNAASAQKIAETNGK
jgi:two-component system sensor histidine kinase BaeS